MSELDKLQELLTRLPGIGPRQARRFAFFLMQVNQDYINQFIDTLSALRSTKYHCKQCNRIYFLSNTHKEKDICHICNDELREHNKILLVAKQADFENIERSGAWRGLYFILGTVCKISDKNPLDKLPIGLLHQALSGFEVEELVFGLPINPEGQYTQDVITEELSSFLKETNITISQLGRGLSVGSELEYSDGETITEALQNRK